MTIALGSPASSSSRHDARASASLAHVVQPDHHAAGEQHQMIDVANVDMDTTQHASRALQRIELDRTATRSQVSR